MQIREIISCQDGDHSTQAQPSRVSQQMANGHGLLSPGGEFWDESDDGVVEIELAGFPKLRDGDGGEGFAGGKPQGNRIGRHIYAGTGLAERGISQGLAVAGDV